MTDLPQLFEIHNFLTKQMLFQPLWNVYQAICEQFQLFGLHRNSDVSVCTERCRLSIQRNSFFFAYISVQNAHVFLVQIYLYQKFSSLQNCTL